MELFVEIECNEQEKCFEEVEEFFWSEVYGVQRDCDIYDLEEMKYWWNEQMKG